MSTARALVPLLAALSLRCTDDGPSGFSSTSVTQTTTSTTQSSFTGDPTTASSGDPATTDPIDPTTTTSTSGASTSGPDPSTSTQSTSSGSTGTSSTTSTDSGSTTGGPPACGDGVVEGDELCDDGNPDEDDACLSDCTAGQALLVLAGAGDGPATFARFVPGPGWSQSQAGANAGEPALVAVEGGALAVVRRSGPVPQDKNELAFATWSPGQPDMLANFADVGDFGYGLDGPGLAAVADTATLAFLGTDNKHYTALYSNKAWSPFAPLPAGMVQIQAFGPSAAALAGGAAETYAVYAGDDGKIYYSVKTSPGGAWQASVAAPPLGVVNTLTPAAVVDAVGDLLVAYVRKADGKIATVKLITPQNSWTTESIVHAEAITDAELALVHTDGDAFYIAWKGYQSSGIHAIRGTAHDKWGTPFTVDEPMAVSAPPALARGVLGAEAELVFPAGGKLRHARLAGNAAASVADVPGTGGLVGRPAAARVQIAP